MAYKMTFLVEEGVLLVEISGKREDNLANSAKEGWSEVARVAREKNLKNILILSRATGKYPTMDAYEINSTLAECGVQRQWKIAFVNLDKASLKEVKFGETVAINRGFNVGVFSKEDDARNWLGSS